MRKIVFVFCCFVMVMFSGCASSTKAGVVGIDRSQFFMVNSKSMDESAALAYTDTLQKAKNAKILNTDAKETKRVRAISKHLIEKVGVFREDAVKWDWQVNVIDDPSNVNAWCMPGGKIAVYTGIINKLKLTDSELAAVVSHEMAHALREHGRERASTDQLKGIGIFAIAQATGTGDTGANLMNMAAQYTIMLPYSRTHETESDIIGLELMSRAGYNPRAAVNLWKKMLNLKGGKEGSAFFSTHPSSKQRISDIEAMIPKVEPLYQQSNIKSKI